MTIMDSYTDNTQGRFSLAEERKISVGFSLNANFVSVVELN